MPMRAGYSDASRAQDLRECRALLRGGSRSFYTASFLLPSRVRDPATALYAFCRLADDAIDHGEPDGDVIAEWQRRLDAACGGVPSPHAADRAFADVVSRFRLPKDLPQALIEGFAWDKAGRTYETIEDVLDYAARVAGSVGAMMSLLMGRREAHIVARACDLGMAMQLTNIARDVGEDARAGRLYLPRLWVREAGLDPDQWLRHPDACAPIAEVTRRVLAVADQLYGRADQGIAQLPKDCRAGIAAARALYAEIGSVIEASGWNSVEKRAVVPASRKAQIVLRALRWQFPHQKSIEAGVVPASQFLVAAVAAQHENETGREVAPLAWWHIRNRFLFVIDLFERLERRERAMRSQSAAA